MCSQEPDLGLVALDRIVEPGRRLRALVELAPSDPRLAREICLQIAARESEERGLLEGVGRLLARISHDGELVTEFDVRDMTAVAFDAFCEWLP